MPASIPADVAREIDAHVASGRFESTDEVLRAAMMALAQQREADAALAAAVADFEAGNVRNFDEVNDEIRRRHGWQKSS